MALKPREPPLRMTGFWVGLRKNKQQRQQKQMRGFFPFDYAQDQNDRMFWWGLRKTDNGKCNGNGKNNGNGKCNQQKQQQKQMRGFFAALFYSFLGKIVGTVSKIQGSFTAFRMTNKKVTGSQNDRMLGWPERLQGYAMLDVTTAWVEEMKVDAAYVKGMAAAASGATADEYEGCGGESGEGADGEGDGFFADAAGADSDERVQDRCSVCGANEGAGV